MCDNCRAGITYKEKNMRDTAVLLLDIVNDFSDYNQSLTFLNLISLALGKQFPSKKM